jgi:hypothetical protein
MNEYEKTGSFYVLLSLYFLFVSWQWLADMKMECNNKLIWAWRNIFKVLCVL